MPRRLAPLALSAWLLLALGPVGELPVGPVGSADAAKRGQKAQAGAPFASDTAADPSPVGFWGEVECVNDGRHQLISSGGDRHPTITGAPQGNDSFRRLSVVDGDDYWGERCELGDDNSKGRTTVYREGTRWITQMSARLPADAFPFALNTWQVVMQMKQAAPAANSGGTPVLSLDAYDGRWRFRQSLSPRQAGDSRELWSAPAAAGSWTRFSFDIRYSRKSSRGAVNVSADLNGDGDFLDNGESSGTIRTYTLKVETQGGSRDGVKPGQSIASHLRTGIYHDDSIDCPPPEGCYIDLDNVQVLRP